MSDAIRRPSFGPLDEEGSLNKILDGLRETLVVGLNPDDQAKRTLLVNVKDGESLGNLKTHAFELNDLFLDGIAAIAAMAAEVQFTPPPRGRTGGTSAARCCSSPN